jgi:hypothetical protein
MEAHCASFTSERCVSDHLSELQPAQARAFGGGGVGGKAGESGSASDFGNPIATTGMLITGPLGSGVAAGSVGTSTTVAPDMLVHQHGAWVPVPWPIGDGIVS